jgi:hypothetical protein
MKNGNLWQLFYYPLLQNISRGWIPNKFLHLRIIIINDLIMTKCVIAK